MLKIRINRLFVLFGIASILVVSACSKSHDKTREKYDFNRDWKFELNDSNNYSHINFDDSQWRKLNLPHDWSIEGNFDESNPAGIGGGALPGGTGWYRKTFFLPQADSGRRVYITFDGVYQNSEVFINENLLGKRPNGYISFQYDLTPYLHYGDKPNIIAVRVDNSDQPNSRWYSGSGIYRNVWLEKTHPIHIDLWGTHVTTHSISEDFATVEISIIIKNTTREDKNLTIETQLIDSENRIVSSELSSIIANDLDTTRLTQELKVNSPKLWSIEEPNLYRAITIIKLDGKEIDHYETTFGIRFFNFDPDKGFSLNGKQVKIKGVCNHHDLGALGAAVNARAIERQLEILKEMGCNGIRTAHNPPAPELLDLCDKMGFIVQNETFDVWAKKKVENDYARYWDEWHERDLKDHIFRDRNHPSVFSWSIGNEILEQWDSTGITIARELSAIVKKNAPGIPVTSGLNFPEPSNFIVQSGTLDLIGFNYHHELFESFRDSFPDIPFIGTETTSSLNSRGEYNMPSDSIRRWPYKWDEPFYDGNPGNTCSSYDNCSAPWGSTHTESWNLIKNHGYLSGMYIWTGFDYLGEPTPYLWPSRSSYFGIVDLAGFPKDAYYLYQSEWTKKPVLHLFPHWNWEPGQEIDVWAYSNFDEVELLVNGFSKGIRKKNAGEFHLDWNVIYQPGNIKAIGRNANGETKEVVIKTAGKPSKIKMEADRSIIEADGKDLSFITVTVLDEHGNTVPRADNLINFEAGELLTIAGVDNGNQISHELFQADYRKAFNGKCLLIVKSKNEKGNALIRATSKSLESASLNLIVE